MTALVRVFKVDVQAITRSSRVIENKVQRKKGKETGETGEDRKLLQELMTVSAVSGLAGVRRDVWADKRNNVVYASARMNRAEGAARYTALIQENEALIRSLQEAAEKASGSFTAYADLGFAAGIAELTDNFYNILGVLNPDAANQGPAYGNANRIRSSLREQTALIVIRAAVTGDVDSRIAKAFASVFSKQGFRTAAAAGSSPADRPYTLKADFKTEDAPFDDTQYYYTRFILTASLMDKEGNELLSFSANDREGHRSQNESKQRAIRSAETVITESGFAKEFDAYLDSL